MTRIRWRCFVAVSGLLTAALAAAGCDRTYSQETPDDVVRSAVEMVRNGDADRLGDLVYAESPEMRALLDRLGGLFKSMEGLAEACRERFPEELAALRAEAERRAAEGKPNQLLASLLSRRGRGRGGADQARMREAINGLLADPYGWLERNAERLGTLRTADDAATVTLDDRPLLQPVGVPLRLEEGKWYVAVPTHMPPLSGVMPRSKAQWSILTSAVAAVDNAVREMTAEVRGGRIRSLGHLGETAQDKLLTPAPFVLMAYSRETQVRRRYDQGWRRFTAKQREWVRERQEKAGEPVSARLVAAMGSVASERIERMARGNERAALDGIADAKFETLVGGWLAERGLEVRLSGDVSAAAVDPVVEAWETEEAKKMDGTGRRR